MRVPPRFLIAAAATATVSGAGGYFLGQRNFKDNPTPIFSRLHAEAHDDQSLPSLQIRLPLPDKTEIDYSRNQPFLQSQIPRNNSAVEIMKYGFPSTDCLLYRDDYILAYDRRNRTALWVAEYLTADRLADRSRAKRTENYIEDLSIHQFFRSSNADYSKSGFDRGHLAAAGNHWLSQKSKDETNLLSNISPQVGIGFNRDAWNRLEQYTRHKTKSCTCVFVMTGPLYVPQLLEDGKLYVKYQVIGTNNVAVPTHFFKALLCQMPNGEFQLECYMMPNKPIDPGIPLQAFQKVPDAIERAAGFLLFPGLPRSTLKSINGRPSS